jgi:hypothetical protein
VHALVLSLTWNPEFLTPVVGTQRGTRKQEGATLGSAAVAAEAVPSGEILARVRKASHMGADVNH